MTGHPGHPGQPGLRLHRAARCALRALVYALRRGWNLGSVDVLHGVMTHVSSHADTCDLRRVSCEVCVSCHTILDTAMTDVYQLPSAALYRVDEAEARGQRQSYTPAHRPTTGVYRLCGPLSTVLARRNETETPACATEHFHTPRLHTDTLVTAYDTSNMHARARPLPSSPYTQQTRAHPPHPNAHPLRTYPRGKFPFYTTVWDDPSVHISTKCALASLAHHLGHNQPSDHITWPQRPLALAFLPLGKRRDVAS